MEEPTTNGRAGGVYALRKQLTLYGCGDPSMPGAPGGRGWRTYEHQEILPRPYLVGLRGKPMGRVGVYNPPQTARVFNP